MNPLILHIAAYRFVALDDLPALRQQLHDSADALALKGTVLLAPEGINLCLAGGSAELRRWLDALGTDARLAGLTVRQSFSDTLPYRRLKVKIKREIIRMDAPEIRPADGRAPAVAPQVLARWIEQGRDEEGRPLALLDTRNRFEVDAGAFDGAVDWRLAKFTEFPAALAAHRDELAGHRVVSYCTGGIRCEKAALLIERLGIAHAVQLDGGILGYFEATGGRAPGWHGRCVVFDERVALRPDLTA